MTYKKKLLPPEHLEPEYLYHKYEPLRKAVFKKYITRMHNQADREDLMGTIDQIFIQLVQEYDPHRGVDFPYYIKKMLELRTYHYITKYLKTINSEAYCEDDIVVEDFSYEDIFNKIIDLNSLDSDIQLGDKHRQLLINTLIYKKTLQEQAKEEGVPVDRLHARMYFLTKKLRKEYEKQVEVHGDNLY